MDSNIQRLVPRFRYGVINPRAPGKVQRGLSYQFYRIVPSDVIEISTGLGLDDYAPSAVEKAISNYWDCVHALMEEKVNVIVLGGVPISVRLGRPRLRDLLAETKQKTHTEVDAPLEALIAAMNHLGLKTIAIGSRWKDDINDAIIRYSRGRIKRKLAFWMLVAPANSMGGKVDHQNFIVERPVVSKISAQCG